MTENLNLNWNKKKFKNWKNFIRNYPNTHQVLGYLSYLLHPTMAKFRSSQQFWKPIRDFQLFFFFEKIDFFSFYIISRNWKLLELFVLLLLVLRSKPIKRNEFGSEMVKESTESQAITPRGMKIFNMNIVIGFCVSFAPNEQSFLAYENWKIIKS